MSLDLPGRLIPGLARPRRPLQVLLAHGLCHLLGYTHDSPAARALMQDRERGVLLGFHDPLGGLTRAQLLAASYLPPPWGPVPADLIPPT